MSKSEKVSILIAAATLLVGCASLCVSIYQTWHVDIHIDVKEPLPIFAPD